MCACGPDFEREAEMAKNRIYVCIDLKSFYASVECIERGLDPLTTHLVVADTSRTEKTICLAVSPSLKACGIPGRPRLFEVIQKVQLVNAQRREVLPGHHFLNTSCNSLDLQAHPELELSFLTAPPRMAHYMEYSTQVYQVYLNYIAPEDIHVYSIDEVFIDLTDYLAPTGLTAHAFTQMMIQDVLKTTGITATAGIGTNLFLAKIAMDIVAKHIPADGDGVRIAELDEQSYRQQLWDHRPLTDFWHVGKGYARKLEQQGLYTMGDIALCSVGKSTDYYNEDLLYRLFGVHAELLIDHAWGWEPCTIAEIKAYKPSSNSIGSGQVLHCAYTAEKAKNVVREMTDILVLSLVEKELVTDQMVLTIGYDIENLMDLERRKMYHGQITTDIYGRQIPKHAHGSISLEKYTSSTRRITHAVMALFDRIVDPNLLIRRVNLVANHIVSAHEAEQHPVMEQLDLWTGSAVQTQQQAAEEKAMEQERRIQQTVLQIKQKFGKNAILKGMNLQEGATAKLRNEQISGHRA